MSSLSAIGVSPVSYTHLDVYKRQPYWCTRDAIYAQFKLIARLETDPDVDEGVKGPLITAARAEIHRLRATISEPPPRAWATIASPLPERPAPCCYARKPLYLR